jgi:hypothetical protein
MEPQSGRSGAKRETVVVENFSGDQLQISSIVLANADNADSTLAIHRDHDVNLVPALVQEFSADQPIYVFYEIYNLTFDAQNQSQYRIDYLVESLQAEKSWAGRAAIRLGKILGLRRQNVTIGSSFESTGNRRDEPLYQSLEILGQPAGEYYLTITLTDRVSGQSVSRRVNFAIKQKSKNKD